MPNSRCSVARIYVAAQFIFSDTEKHVTTQEHVFHLLLLGRYLRNIYSFESLENFVFKCS